MGVRNYLVEGVSGTGKTSVCSELERRGYHAINGDRELAYQGDPETGEPTDGLRHEHHLWHIDKVKSLIANQDDPVTFFCGGSRNFPKFIDLFDGVFVLEVDAATLNRRLAERLMMSGAGNNRNETSSCVCIRRKRTCRMTASYRRHQTARVGG